MGGEKGIGRPSSVQRVPQNVREVIHDLRQQGATLDEIVAEVEGSFGVGLSRSAVHRHLSAQAKALEAVARTRAVAEAVVRGMGENESKSSRALAELLHGALVDMVLTEPEYDEDGKQITPGGLPDARSAQALCGAFERLSRARRHDAELAAKLRDEGRKEAADAAGAAMQAAGVDAATASSVLGHLAELTSKPTVGAEE